MIKSNSKIKIIASPQLSDMLLDELVGREGTVTEELTASERRNKGYMVQLNEHYQEEHLWFIPQESVIDV